MADISSHDIKILIKRVISAKHTYVISFKNVFVIVTAFLVFFFSVDQDPIKFGRRSCISLWLTNRHITCFPGVPTYIKYTCSLFSGRIYLHHVNTVFDLPFSIKRNLVIHNHIGKLLAGEFAFGTLGIYIYTFYALFLSKHTHFKWYMQFYYFH